MTTPATIRPNARGPVIVGAAPTTTMLSDSLPNSVTAPTGTIDAFLRRVVEDARLAPNLADAVLYSLLGPGKRARPLLTWHSFAAVSGRGLDAEDCLPAAAAVELVHAFSLVHDDLPGLDNDDLRRGRPTLHRHTSVAMAVLAGDAMLTLAFQAIAQRVAPALAGPLCAELAVATNAMITGQVYDTLGGFGPGLPDRERLELIHRNKTGALIRVACRVGAMAALHRAGAQIDDTEPRLAAITRYAEAAGLMFQIVDDLLDVTQTTEHLGKRTGKDQDAGKLTYPGVMGVDASRDEVRRLHEVSIAALAPLGPAAEPLRQLASFMAGRTK